MGEEPLKPEITEDQPATDVTMSGTPTPTKPKNPAPNSLLTPSSSSHGLTAENTIDLSQPNPSSSKPHSPTHLPRRVSTSEVIPLQHPIPKPRSNSALQSSRPAPPSPAPSRPGSQICSSVGTASPAPSSPGKEPLRDRAGSTSSSRGGVGIGRRPSGGAQVNRGPSKARPRSALGSSFIAPDDEPSESNSRAESPAMTPTSSVPVTPSTTLPESSLTATAIPEDPSPRSSTEPDAQTRPNVSPDPVETPTAASPAATSPTVGSTSSSPVLPTVTIRDFAFGPSDSRFAGPGLPLSAPDQPRQSSRWFGGSDESGSSKRSWSGFGFMSFRNFMRKKDSTDPTTGDDPDDEEREEEFPIVLPDHDEDDYAFSSDSGVEEDEPWGLYRAVYPFEAVGEHEIGLEEGDLVDLRGRGGGDGWVVGVRRILNPDGKVVGETEEGEEKEGLVPESYLEKVDLKILLRERERFGSTGVEKISMDDSKLQDEAIPEEGEEVNTPTVVTTKLGALDGQPTRGDAVKQSTLHDNVETIKHDSWMEPTKHDEVVEPTKREEVVDRGSKDAAD